MKTKILKEINQIFVPENEKETMQRHMAWVNQRVSRAQFLVKLDKDRQVGSAREGFSKKEIKAQRKAYSDGVVAYDRQRALASVF